MLPHFLAHSGNLVFGNGNADPKQRTLGESHHADWAKGKLAVGAWAPLAMGYDMVVGSMSQRCYEKVVSVFQRLAPMGSPWLA